MGLFSYNYTKAGKGVSPNAPKKNAFFMFFELVGRKIFQLIELNLMYFVVILPLFIYVYGSISGWAITFLGVSEDQAITPLLQVFGTIQYYVPAFLHTPLFILSAILYGPATASLTYILRNYGREEHAFISDFFSKAKENFVQGLLMGLLDILVVIILFTNINYGSIIGANNLLTNFLRYFSVILFVFYIILRNYAYQLIITTKLKFRAILKNARIFIFLGFFRNLFSVVIFALLTLLTFGTHPLAELLLSPFLYLVLMRYIGVYTIYPVVKKYIIEPAKAKKGKEPEDSLDLASELVLPPELGGPGAGTYRSEKFRKEQGIVDKDK